jgi:diadenosine tetraphosphate (Ap4A) HIT family hydrolase
MVPVELSPDDGFYHVLSLSAPVRRAMQDPVLGNSFCPFCALESDYLILANEHALAIRDRFPLSEGHTLIIPTAHVPSIFDVSTEASNAIWELVRQVREQLAQQLQPDAFTVGINDGQAAGQTVEHAHIHVIPRWAGDVPDPCGGIRWIIPKNAPYWKTE